MVDPFGWYLQGDARKPMLKGPLSANPCIPGARRVSFSSAGTPLMLLTVSLVGTAKPARALGSLGRNLRLGINPKNHVVSGLTIVGSPPSKRDKGVKEIEQEIAQWPKQSKGRRFCQSCLNGNNAQSTSPLKIPTILHDMSKAIVYAIFAFSMHILLSLKSGARFCWRGLGSASFGLVTCCGKRAGALGTGGVATVCVSGWKKKECGQSLEI